MQQASTTTLPVSSGAKKSRNVIWSWSGALIVVAAVVAPLMLQRYGTFDPVMVSTFGYALVFAFGVIGSITFFLPVPVLTLVFVGATMLNPFLLSLSAAAGITVGMACCYALGKAGHRFAKRAQPDPATRLYRLTSRAAAWYSANVTTASFVIAATPNPVFDYAGYFAGLLRVDCTRFLLATFAGKMVQSLIVALLGYYAFDQISSWW
jgi:uncharacterized membrane protein YdjX (TVP38/TMEM64 family)